ncbi:YheC/YheD family protein [Paenibacillus sp. FSL K6-1217]|uniref:YheC/YheD family protein n=1 Tax=Paenibacillus sp. FSL K6-1217 TaxID=2921466 RepID=UPI0032469F87
MPETLLYQSSADLHRMLRSSSVVYVKPINGTGGRDILRIERQREGKSLFG